MKMKQNHYLKRGLKVLLILLISFQNAFSQFKVVGYMPSWSGSANAIQYSKLTHINYAFLLPNSSGGFAPIENPSKLQSIVSSAHANGVKVFIAVGGWNNGNDSGFETFAASSSGRTTFVNNMINFVNQYNLDGVDIDWEYPDAGASANNYAALMQQLGDAMHSRGKGLSAAVVGSGSQGGGVLSSVFAYVDHLNLMAYDYNNFDHSTYNNAVESMTYWKGRGCPANKVIIGVPFYGRPSWESFATLVGRGADPNADVFAGVGYNGIATIKKKTQLAKDQAGGIMMWELSQDAVGANSLLTAINQVVGSNPPPPPTQGPYGGTARNIPGKIEAEHYDIGGQGVAYNDATTANEGGAFRTDGVDIEATTDAGAGYNVGWTAAGEWLEYTVNVTATGNYNFEFRVAAITTGKSFHVEFDGQNVTGSIAVPNTGGWQTWQTVTINNKALSAGQKIMKVAFDTDAINLNNINIVSSGTTTNTPPTVSLTSPANGSSFAAGTNVSITATASDANGTVSKVEFFVDGTKISEDVTNPYTATYTNAVAGTHTISARSTDNAGALSTTSSVSITINGTTTNTPPTVSITSPGNGSSFAAGTNVAISANASDANGTVSKVEFFVDGIKISEDATSPYNATYTNAVAGTRIITAKATDNSLATTTSAAISITITSTNTGGCSGVAQYVENGGYAAGSKVQNVGGLYQCKPWPYSGWCNGAAWAYGPGTGAYWSDAWDKIGSCSGTRLSSNAYNTKFVEVYPNPTDKTASVKLNVDGVNNAEISVVNPMGIVVFKGNLSNSNLEGIIDLTGMDAGIYMIKITSNGDSWYEKLLKQ